MACGGNCSKCADFGTCLGCLDGFYLDVDGLNCVACPGNCSSCVYSVAILNVTCTQCLGGFYKAYNQTKGQVCLPCDNDGCQVCQPSNTTTKTNIDATDGNCSFCAQFSSLINGVCLKCSTNCTSCTN